ncbi:MAG: hypothetical protein PWQ93_356 [Clostridiales bacterium]|nr:hypothetical protein [Clostridiales bacterium]
MSKSRKTKSIALLLILAFVFTNLFGGIGTVAFATDEGTRIYGNDKYETAARNSFVKKYAGVDLVSKNFDRTKMTAKESKAFDALLDLMYLENQDAALDEGYSKEEYKALAEDILSGNININRPLLSKAPSNAYTCYATSHGLISTKLLGGILNGIISATLLVTGVGSIYELVKKMGKEAAKDWVEKHLKKTIVDKLTAIGLKNFGIYVGSIISGIVNVYLDPGGWLAERIDAVDKIPNNGYIEAW